VFWPHFCCPVSQQQHAFKANNSSFPPLQCKTQGEAPASQSFLLAVTSLSFVGYNLTGRNLQFLPRGLTEVSDYATSVFSGKTHNIGKGPSPLPCSLIDNKLSISTAFEDPLSTAIPATGTPQSAYSIGAAPYLLP